MRPRFLPAAQRPQLLPHACVLLVLSTAAIAAPFDILDAVQDATLLNGARALAVSPDGAHVYVAALVASSVAAFAVDPGSGALTSRGAITDDVEDAVGLGGCADLAISPDGRHLYVAGFADDAIAILERDTATGALGFVDAVFDVDLATPGLDGASGVVVSPDGRHVYATAGLADTVIVFARDADAGLLTLVEIEDDVPSQLLAGAAEVAISPSGDRVYVIAQEAAPAGDALVTFSRDADTGALTRIDAEQQGVGGVGGLEIPNSLTVSPDGAHIYTVAGSAQFVALDAIALFVRAPLDGTTSFLGLWSDGNGGIDGIDAAFGITVTPDGGHLLATGPGDGALAIFERDRDTGLLAFDRAIRDDADATRLLGGAIDVAVDPLGRFVYVASFSEDALTVFAPEPAAAALGAAACAALAFRRRRAVETC